MPNRAISKTEFSELIMKKLMSPTLPINAFVSLSYLLADVNQLTRRGRLGAEPQLQKPRISADTNRLAGFRGTEQRLEGLDKLVLDLEAQNARKKPVSPAAPKPEAVVVSPPTANPYEPNEEELEGEWEKEEL